jgi:3-oxoacyl-[acyl-carrier-protein] synthase I
MKRPLFIVGVGAVTPAGLNARQTLAAVRATLSAYEDKVLTDPFGAMQIVARIPTHHALRSSARDWLTNLAARAIRETLRSTGVRATASAVFIVSPEQFRQHPAFDEVTPSAFLEEVMLAVGERFHDVSRVIDGGAAATLGLIEHASELLELGSVDQVVIGGVDSLVNDTDIARLLTAGRLLGPKSPQGLIPGEGAAFVALRLAPDKKASVAATVHRVGVASEDDTALTDRYSQGRALLSALRAAAGGSGPGEGDIHFVVSNSNGERYDAWESFIARPRFYRTRREFLPKAYAAMTFGDLGAASGAMTLMLAADSFAKNYAPGPVAMCEVTSEGGLRAAAVLSRVS